MSSQPDVRVVNFFKPVPNAIHSLAYDDSTSRLAVSRSDSSIEIWDLTHTPFVEKVIPAISSNSIETLAWCKGRLFSGGLHGRIIEYDLDSLTTKKSVPINVGCCIWCISVNKQNTFLAAGTEDGYISIYRISSTGLDFEKTLNKQEGRILCLAWHPSDETIVAGSIDAIRIWDVSTGYIVERILVGRQNRNRETIVWCIAVTSDMTIISGDSQGRTSFWNGRNATQIMSMTSHKADVLTLCLSQDESTVYAAGVDPRIILFSRVPEASRLQSGDKSKWLKSVHRDLHSHDVRSLIMAGDYLVSGGVDTNLVFSKYPPKVVKKYSPFCRSGYTSVAAKAKVLLVHYPEYLELWKLCKGTCSEDQNSSNEGKLYDEKKILKIQPRSSPIVSAISQDGKWLAYYSEHKFRLLLMTEEKSLEVDSHVTPQQVKVPFKTLGCKILKFTPSGRLIVLTSEGNIHVVQCNISETEILYSLEREEGTFQNAHILAVSENDNYLACAFHDGAVSVYNLANKKLHCHLPHYKCQATALQFDVQSENLFAVYTDKKIVDFNMKKKACNYWCEGKILSAFQIASVYPIRGIVCCPRDTNRLLLYDDETLYYFDKSKIVNRLTKDPENSENEKDIDGFKIIQMYKYLLDLHSLGGNKLVPIEVLPEDVESTLPPPLYRKKYGT